MATLSFESIAQSEALALDAKPILEERYQDFQGSAYLFDEWTPALIKDNDVKLYPDVWINLNGLENEMEITLDQKKYIVADPKLYPEIIIENAEAAKALDMEFLSRLKFISKPDPKWPADYYLELYKSPKAHLLFEFTVSQSTITQRPPGQIIEIHKLNKRSRLVLISDGDQKGFSLNKKQIKNAFAGIGDILQWAKKKKLKPDSYETLVRYLQLQEGE